MLPGFFLYKKILYECSDEFWNRVKAYKREKSIATLNEAMTELIESGLQKFEMERASVFESKLIRNTH